MLLEGKYIGGETVKVDVGQASKFKFGKGKKAKTKFKKTKTTV